MTNMAIFLEKSSGKGNFVKIRYKMKKLLTVLAAAIFMSATASAQYFNFGVKGGVAANWMPGTQIDWYSGLGPAGTDRVLPNIGFYAGVSGTLEMDGSFFPQIEILYSRKGITTNNDIFGKYSRDISYIQVPLLAGFKLSDDRFRVTFGPEFGFCIGQKVKYGNQYEVDPASLGNPKPFNFAVALQATYLIADGFGVEAKFDYGVTTTLDEPGDRGRNMSTQIGICYYFGL